LFPVVLLASVDNEHTLQLFFPSSCCVSPVAYLNWPLSWDIAMDNPATTDPIEMPPDLCFGEKWEFLKPHIEQLYVHQNHKLVHAIEIFKERYGFDAT
jgi:Clr5 domain